MDEGAVEGAGVGAVRLFNIGLLIMHLLNRLSLDRQLQCPPPLVSRHAARACQRDAHGHRRQRSGPPSATGATSAVVEGLREVAEAVAVEVAEAMPLAAQPPLTRPSAPARGCG